MKTLVTYFSQTGKTESVAQAIFEEIEGDKEIKKFDEVTNLGDYDLAFIGFPVHSAGPAKPAKAFLENNVAGKRIALFVTHASAEDAPDLPAILEKCKAAAGSAEIVGMFNCQGQLSDEIIGFLKKSDNPAHQAFAAYGPQTKGQPDSARIDKARAFARSTMASV